MILDSKNYESFYKKEIGQIDKYLNNLLKGRKPESLYEPCSYILNGGGKRLRPFLVLLSAKAVGGKLKDVYNAAAAVEILHNFTLVHDDIMDNSDKRRGRATLHKKYDLSTAILAGDNLIALAYHSLLKDCKKNIKALVAIFTQAIIEVCEGQSMDKDFETRQTVPIDEYKVMIFKKTAALTEMCCSVGALLGGANKKELKAAANYGKFLGMAFQIQDDLLDITAQEKTLGKTVGSDLIEGKKTYLFLKGLEKSSGKEKAELIKVVKQKGIDKSEINKYRELYIKLGVLKDAEREIMKYTKLAFKNLSFLPNEEGRNLMHWLANILISRDK